jgi:hypothetical protein
MQIVRGFIYFEGKSINDLKENFKNFQLENLELSFFEYLFRYDKYIFEHGIFFSGEVDKKYSSEDIAIIFRQHLNLEEKQEKCDISIESEDTIYNIKNESLEGNYIGIRIKPPYDLAQIKDLSHKIGELVDASNVFVRTVELDNKVPLVCIDLITQNEYHNHKQRVEKLISNNELVIDKYTYMRLN